MRVWLCCVQRIIEHQNHSFKGNTMFGEVCDSFLLIPQPIYNYKYDITIQLSTGLGL